MTFRSAQHYQRIAQDLAKNAALPDGNLRLSVKGNSMRPLLASGDLVIVRPTSLSQLQIGDIVSFQDLSGITTHRLIAVSEDPQRDQLLGNLKGDQGFAVDEPVPADAILGQVLKIETSAGSLVLAHAPQQAHRLLGRLARAEAERYRSWRRSRSPLGLLGGLFPAFLVYFLKQGLVILLKAWLSRKMS